MKTTTKTVLDNKGLEALPNALLIKELVEYGSGKMCFSPYGYLKVLAQNDKDTYESGYGKEWIDQLLAKYDITFEQLCLAYHSRFAVKNQHCPNYDHIRQCALDYLSTHK